MCKTRLLLLLEKKLSPHILTALLYFSFFYLFNNPDNPEQIGFEKTFKLIFVYVLIYTGTDHIS